MQPSILVLEDDPQMGADIDAVRVPRQNACHQNGQRLVIAPVAPLVLIAQGIA